MLGRPVVSGALGLRGGYINLNHLNNERSAPLYNRLILVLFHIYLFKNQTNILNVPTRSY